MGRPPVDLHVELSTIQAKLIGNGGDLRTGSLTCFKPLNIVNFEVTRGPMSHLTGIVGNLGEALHVYKGSENGMEALPSSCKHSSFPWEMRLAGPRVV